MNALAPPITGTARYPQSAPYPQRGLTLVELMIAVGLGVLLVIAVGAVYMGNNQTYRAAEDVARTQEAGRYALDVIGRSLRQAGFVKLPPKLPILKTVFTGDFVKGMDSACTIGTTKTDMTTVRYWSSVEDPPVTGAVVEQDCQANDLAAGEIVQQTFFIAADPTTSVPSLRCDAKRQVATPPALPTGCPGSGDGAQLLENVEDLQILYGIDTTGDGAADSYTATPGVWGQVVSARVCLLVRSENLGSTKTSTQTYLTCAGALGTATTAALRFQKAPDTRLRRAFVATFTLRNRITGVP